jgi:hypothetical protein
METISTFVWGRAGQTSIDLFIPLTNNVDGTINYIVRLQLYFGYTGSSGTWGYKDTSTTIGNWIIHNRTTTGIYIYASKSGSGDNLSVYLNCLGLYDTKGTDSPASY